MALPDNPLDAMIGYQLRRVSAELMGGLARMLGALGLTPTEASMLVLVVVNPGITQSEIGRMLGIKRANMAPLTATLDARGLISRERVDGRSQGLLATERGHALCLDARRVMAAHDAHFLGRLPPDARHGLAAALSLLRPEPREPGDAR